MTTRQKLGHWAGAAGLAAMMALSTVPANASVQGRDTLLGAGIGAVAGGLLGHGRPGAVVGGAALGAVVGALAAPHHKYYAYYYGHRYAYHTGHYWHGHYYPHGYYAPYYPRG